MTTASQGIGSGWQVIGQTQVTDANAEGRFVDGLRVTFRTGLGHTGSVFIPLDAATPDNVAQVISERAMTMDGIAGLSVPAEG